MNFENSSEFSNLNGFLMKTDFLKFLLLFINYLLIDLLFLYCCCNLVFVALD